jgi:hypothetical protein
MDGAPCLLAHAVARDCNSFDARVDDVNPGIFCSKEDSHLAQVIALDHRLLKIGISADIVLGKV